MFQIVPLIEDAETKEHLTGVQRRKMVAFMFGIESTCLFIVKDLQSSCAFLSEAWVPSPQRKDRGMRTLSLGFVGFSAV